MAALAQRVSARLASRRDVVRADPVTMEEFGYLLAGRQGRSTGHAGVMVDDKRALGITAWWSGVRFITEAVSFLPWHTFRGAKAQREQRADPLWLRKPDAAMPWAALVEHWTMSLLHRGNAYAGKLRNEAGQVVGLRAVHPDRVKAVGLAPDGTKVFQVDNGGGPPVPMTSRELLHIVGMSTDGIVGLDPIRVHAEALGLAAAADEYAARSFSQGSHLRAYLSLPQALTTDQARELLDEWRAFHTGVQSANGFGVLGNGAEYRTISLDPQQVQLLESRKFSVTEVARILRIPPHRIYDLERSTFSNIEHQSIDAVTDGVRPWVERIETWVNFDPDLLRPGNFVEAQLEGLLRGDTASRYASYGAAINAGWMTPQYAAALENVPAPDELNYYQRPLNVAVVRPGEGSVPDEPTARDLAEVLQKVYLAVGKVITADEARAIANRAGADLDMPGPKLTPDASATPATEVNP